MADINLIPQEVKTEQAQVKVVRRTTVYSVILALAVVIISAAMIVQSQMTRSRISQLNSNIENLRGDISGLSEIEISARNLDMKSQTVDSVLTNRLHYSILMTEFKKRIPETVSIESFGTGKDNTITVSGAGADYLSVAKFVNDLADTSFAGAGAGMQGLFKGVSLNSVSLDSQSNLAKFFIILTVDSEVLKK